MGIARINNSMWKKLLSVVIIIGLIGGIYAYRVHFAQAACAPASGWSYCNSLTIDHTKVSTVNGTALIGFPIEASSTISQLATVGNGGHIQNTTTETGSSYTGTVPADLQFSTSSSFTTLIPGWEFESYNSATGNIVLWANMGNSISTTTDTALYFQYGNSSVTTWQGNVNRTWNSNYMAVYHLPNGSTLNGGDSTANALTMTSPGTVTASSTCQMDGCAGFDQTGSDYLQNTTGTSTAYGGVSISLDGWVNVATGAGGSPDGVVQIGRNGTSILLDWSNGGGGRAQMNAYGPSPAQSAFTTLNSWHLFSGTYNYGSGTSTLYVDGIATNSSNWGQYSLSSGRPDFEIGTGNADAAVWKGKLDELRFSTGVESADWISTEYNNQSAPDKANYSGGFYTVGTEQSGGGGGAATSTSSKGTILNIKGYFVNGKGYFK